MILDEETATIGHGSRYEKKGKEPETVRRLRFLRLYVGLLLCGCVRNDYRGRGAFIGNYFYQWKTMKRRVSLMSFLESIHCNEQGERKFNEYLSKKICGDGIFSLKRDEKVRIK